ncbi:MAG: hypothetical protein E7386_01765 [Ruminococcaceae bacterium]|nr:hypothetical protein [Oscillospiraceae bacterium]
MRRDYFTCVFLGLIAGALMFVCFAPLYFVYGGTVPRDFGLFERLMSLLYALFFVFFLPFFAAFRDKVWVNWGLAAYGVLIYLPKFFYPAEALISGNDPKFTKMLLAVLLRGIYGMMQAPFAALSPLVGDKAASALVYWILPMALIWPFVMKIFRFYRRAYLSEQLNPMPKVKPAVTTAHTGPAVKPEVLGTVITAPVVAASPDEVTGKAVLSQNNARESNNAIEEPKEKEAPAIQLEAPASGEDESPTIRLDAPVAEEKKEDQPEKAKTPDVIELGAPPPPGFQYGSGISPDNVENDNDTL